MMERQNFGLGLLIILVLGGVIPLLPTSVRPGSSAFKPTKAVPSESQTPPGVPLPAVSPDLRTILRRYLDDRDQEVSAKLDSLDPRHQIEVESLIAIVPDPIESRFGDVFDAV